MSFPGDETRDVICSNVTTCMEDSYEAVIPTPTSDRVCEQCAVCADSHYETAACTATSNRGEISTCHISNGSDVTVM